MLEIPESNVIARQLNEAVKGKMISLAEANKSPHKFAWYYKDPKDYDGLLAGKTIGDSFACGQMVETQVENMRILIGDGASLKYYSDCKKAPSKHQLYIEFTDGSALAATIQMYGGLWAFPEGQNDNPYYLGACAKPSPLSDEFTYEYFRSLYTGSLANKSVKAFLATQQRIPGLGNGVLQDILFLSGNHPKRKMNTLSEEEFEQLYDTIRSVLAEMTAKGGRDTEKDLYGNNGGYLTYLSKNTYLTPCTKCGYELRRESYLGGNIYFCEHCQKES